MTKLIECSAVSRSTTKKPSKPMECDFNEFYSDCGTRCGQLCLDVAKKLVCPKRKFCISGCFCKEGMSQLCNPYFIQIFSYY